MRLNEMNIGGIDYPICLSTRSMIKISEKFGSLEAVYDKLKSENTADVLKTAIWMISLMMDAGARYVAAQGGTPPKIPSEDDILDITGIDDLNGLTSKTISAMRENVTPAVSVESGKESKNVETTPAV